MKNDNPLKILIVGCGQVGRNLAEQLVEQGNNVTVIDTSANLVNEISAVYDCIGVVGNGATHEVQREAGIKVLHSLKQAFLQWVSLVLTHR